MSKKKHLFEALELFANLGNQPEDRDSFLQRYPTFLPTRSLKKLSIFQEHLRSAWVQSDDTISALTFLLGLGRSTALPKAQPKLDSRGRISLELACEFQRQVHDLFCTGEDWRAMRCKQCRRFFVATKTAQKHCGPECYLEFKRQRSLVHWNTKGRKKREQRHRKQRRVRA